MSTTGNKLALLALNGLSFRTGASYTERLSIASTGAATFSSSVTANSLNINTSTIFVKANIADALSSTSVGSNYNPGILNIQNTNTTNGNLSLIGFQDASAFINLAAIGAINTTHSSSPNSVVGELAFYTKASGTGYITEKMRITSGGNVGIGTTTPTNLAASYRSVCVNGSTAGFFETRVGDVSCGRFISDANATGFGDIRTSIPIYFYTQDTERMRITSAGNVGIGTTSPTEKLEVLGPDASGAAVRWRMGGSRKSGYLYSDSAGVAIYDTNINDAGIYLAQNSQIDFRVSGATRMYINSSGNVGIGTTSPATLLNLKSSTTTELRLESIGGTYRSFIGFRTDGQKYDLGVNLNDTLDSLSINYAGTERLRITSGGIIYALNTGVDGSYQPMIGGMYSSNNNETNLISTAVSSAAAQSGFRFDVSNGAGSAARTTSMTINRSSVTIVGSLSKGSGSFKIDHPLLSKKDTHHLVHSFIEGPQADNIYRGKIQLVNGKATINLDQTAKMTEGTFVLLNGNIQCFTSNESGWTAVKGIVAGNILTIEAQNPECTDTVSWLVIGERIDQHMLDTEWTDENGKVITEPLKQ